MNREKLLWTVVLLLGVMDAPAPVALQLTTAPAAGVAPRSTTMRKGLARSCPAGPDCPLPLGSEAAADRAAGSGPPPTLLPSLLLQPASAPVSSRIAVVPKLRFALIIAAPSSDG